jgi:hypothetical protein
MKNVFLISLGGAALGFGTFLLSHILRDLRHTGFDPFALVVLGMVLTLLLAGAGLVFAGVRALLHRDWTPGKWSRVAFYLVVLDAAALLVLPHFVKARTYAAPGACRANQVQIDGAKQQWAMEHKKTALDTPSPSDLTPYFPQNVFPVCERGGTYQIGTVGEKTTCTAHLRTR